MSVKTELALLLETIVAESVPSSDVALLLSGGVDSLSLGFAASATGKTVHAYTFQVGEWESKDSRAAQRASRLMGWDCELIKVPIDNLERDFISLARQWKCKKKTQFECTWPFLYVIPRIKEQYILSGIAADGHFGVSKKAMIHFRYPKEKFDEFRRAYFSSPNPAGQVQQKAIIEHYGKSQVAPYLDRRVFDYFIQFDHDQINKPKQKILTLRAYPDLFRLIGRRPHENLQLVAGVDVIFRNLLGSPLNTKGRTRVMDLCRDYSGYTGHDDEND
jgi:asparagine synthetase B (glutamine-hydrolysing)